MIYADCRNRKKRKVEDSNCKVKGWGSLHILCKWYRTGSVLYHLHILSGIRNLLGRFNQTSPLHELFGHLPVMMVDEEAMFLVQQGYGRHVIRI